MEDLGCVSLEKSKTRIFDLRSLGPCCIKGTNVSLPRVDSLIPLIHHDLSDLESIIRIQIFPKLIMKNRLRTCKPTCLLAVKVTMSLLLYVPSSSSDVCSC